MITGKEYVFVLNVFICSLYHRRRAIQGKITLANYGVGAVSKLFDSTIASLPLLTYVVPFTVTLDPKAVLGYVPPADVKYMVRGAAAAPPPAAPNPLV
jgi:hypothetical protein